MLAACEYSVDPGMWIAEVPILSDALLVPRESGMMVSACFLGLRLGAGSIAPPPILAYQKMFFLAENFGPKIQNLRLKIPLLGKLTGKKLNF